VKSADASHIGSANVFTPHKAYTFVPFRLLHYTSHPFQDERQIGIDGNGFIFKQAQCLPLAIFENVAERHGLRSRFRERALPQND
jgi:hypothetical protein